jgi:cytoskeletal protein RodZ
MPAERTASSFGARLRDARERRGVSLREIANATKISVGVLEALERNDISKLPGGIFGRAFVRNYAIEVGLDPEATIEDFMTQFPNDSVIAGHPTSDRVEDNVAVESERRTAGTFLWLVVISVPIAAGLVYFATLGRHAGPAPVRPAIAGSRASEAGAAPAPLPPSAAEPPPGLPTATVPAVPSAGTGGTSAPAAPPAAAATPATTPAAAQAAPPAGGQLTIGLTAKRPCWISATVDGQKSIERLLQAGEQQIVTVRREMVLTAGDASAIAVQFNGADGRALGNAGDVVTARFTLANYKDYLQVR